MEEKKKYSQKTINFLSYVTGKATLTSSNKNSYSRGIKFEEMSRIIDSDLGILRKIEALSKIYKSHDQLVAAFEDLEELKEIPEFAPLYEKYKQISTFYRVCEENGLIEVAKDLIHLEEANYFDDYGYARQFIEDYINYNDSPYTSDFLKESGLTEMTFNRFIEIISELDSDLYDKFVEKEQFNKGLRILEVTGRMNNIKTGVKTGKLPNGEEFDRLAFYANFPFYKEEYTREILKDFNARNAGYIDQRFKALMQQMVPESTYDILKYVFDNKLLSSTSTPINEKVINNTRNIINGREITDEEKAKMIEYMNDNRISWLTIGFQEVRDRYLAGTLDLESGKKLVKETKKSGE